MFLTMSKYFRFVILCLSSYEIFIIPARLEECDVVEDLQRWQWVDLFEANGYETLMRALRALANKVGATLQVKRNWLPSITSPRLTSDKPNSVKTFDEPKGKVVEKKKQNNDTDDFPEGGADEWQPSLEKVQEPKSDVPLHDNFPTGCDEEWQPSFDAKPNLKPVEIQKPAMQEKKPASKIKPTEERKLETAKQHRKLNAPFIAAIIGALVIILAIGASIAPQLFKSAPMPTATSTIALLQNPISTFTALLPSETPQPSLTPTDADTPTATTIPLPTPTLGIGSTWISLKDGMVMVYVPAGSFQMGSGKGPASSVDFHYLLGVGPAHTVYLDAFWIDQTDVTNAMYAKCTNAGACPPPTNRSSSTHSSYYGNSQFDDYPVIYVDWNMAQTYCQWAGQRLPTEAEWEKTARGTDARLYPWSNYLHPTYANCNNQVGDTTSVRTYEIGKSPYGAYDMAGNVQQWVEDWYVYNYYATLGDNVHNPQGPSSGDNRVLRGGSWKGSVRDFEVIRSDFREANFPTASGNDIGFRCARSAQ